MKRANKRVPEDHFVTRKKMFDHLGHVDPTQCNSTFLYSRLDRDSCRSERK